MKKIIILGILASIAQVGCLFWLIYSIASLPIVQKIGAKLSHDIVVWSESK